MRPLRFVLRTPAGILVDEEAVAITAEDATGWFGIRRGREDVVAMLPPGLLAIRMEGGERFVAHSGGLLDLRGGRCHAILRHATVGEDLDTIADALGSAFDRRRASSAAHRDVLDDLEREALRRLVKEPQ